MSVREAIRDRLLPLLDALRIVAGEIAAAGKPGGVR